ncbi:MAG: DUF4178 domain-containing protein [Acidobacteria bacterium]|nr:DUF4178 domain-containing protein [Acidobacteriota bacterium]
MSILKTSCPACAGPIEFTAGSTIVVICPYCRSAVARTDRGVEDLGKIAEVAQSQSPLKVGLKGQFNGERFSLTGRAQMRHEMGGTWDEWYATFSNGWVGWLAEAQGRFYLTFYQPMPEGTALPGIDALVLGQPVSQIPSQVPLIVQERGSATYAAAEGEIPYKLTPGEVFQYADLAGKNDAFATIDYSVSPPWVFVGKQVSLAEIGLGDAKPHEREARTVSSGVMRCPKCGGPLALQAPDSSERVACPNCRSLLDVKQGNLSYFTTLRPSPMENAFVLPVGAEGNFPGDVKFKIIGAMQRSVTIEGETYFWQEYLLYNPMIGFRWLVHSDNHWNFVEPVNTAEVESTGTYSGSTATYNGETYKIFQDATAVVEYVKGEFYWRVEQGETVKATDYVCAPRMLSREATHNEVNWSVGTYLPVAEVEKIFGVTDLPKPWAVAPNQPFTGRFWYTWGALPLVALLFIAIVGLPLWGISKTAYKEQIVLPAAPSAGAQQQVFSKPFTIQANRNVNITARATLANTWVDLDVDLINDKNDEVESVNIPLEFYSGVDGGESWSEGSNNDDATVSSLPGGQYTLRIAGTWEKWQTPMPVEITVEQGINRGVNFCCAFLLLLIAPILGILRKWSFEASRWKDSMFAPVSSDDDDE